MKIEMIVERTKTGYSAYSEKYPVFTVGKSLQELKANMLEALNLHFEAKGKIFTEADLKITLDFVLKKLDGDYLAIRSMKLFNPFSQN